MCAITTICFMMLIFYFESLSGPTGTCDCQGTKIRSQKFLDKIKSEVIPNCCIEARRLRDGDEFELISKLEEVFHECLYTYAFEMREIKKSEYQRLNLEERAKLRIMFESSSFSQNCQ